MPLAVKVVLVPEHTVTLEPADAVKGLIVTVTVFDTAAQPLTVTLTL